MSKVAYYNRTISDDLFKRFKDGGELEWIIDYVNKKDCLDFQTGSNKRDSWFSVYRGTGRVLTINLKKGALTFNASKAYKVLNPTFYANPTEEEFDRLLAKIEEAENLTRYYNESNEGYYQTLIGRRYCLDCKENDEFVIFDKEFILGYDSKDTRKDFTKEIVIEYQGIIGELKKGGNAWTKNLEQTGNECDFVAINSKGDIILIELKHAKNTLGVSLSPLQVNKYSDLLSKYLDEREGLNKKDFEEVVLNMIAQKIELGILNPKWKIPKKLSGTILRYVVCGSRNIEKYPTKEAKRRFCEVRSAVKNEEIKLFVCDYDGNLTDLGI